MRIPAKVDYAIRAMAELASVGDTSVKAEQLADAQGIPLKFLRGILTDLRRGRLVRSQRGPEGGFVLGRPASKWSRWVHPLSEGRAYRGDFRRAIPFRVTTLPPLRG